MPRARLFVELFLDNPLHREIVELLRKEQAGEGGAAQPVNATPPQSPSEDSTSLPDTDANLNRGLARLVRRIHNTEVGDHFLIPVIGRMNAGQWYTLDDLTAFTQGRYNRRQVHSLLARAGVLEKEGHGVIFERQKDESGGPQKYRITAELQQAVVRRAA